MNKMMIGDCIVNNNSLLNQALKIADDFLAILQEDKIIDLHFENNKKSIEKEYQQKLTEIETKKNCRISNAVSADKSAQANIQEAFSALDSAESKISIKHRQKYKKCTVIPLDPDFQTLDKLASMINDVTLSATVKRLTGSDGYTSKSDMVNEYMNRIECGREFLKSERTKSNDYLAHEKKAAEDEYARGKKLAEKNRKESLERNERAYDQSARKLQEKLLKVINDSEIGRFDSSLDKLLDTLGAYEDGWNKFVPSTSYPSELLIGAVEIPIALPLQIGQMLSRKMPVSFASGRNIVVPLTIDLTRPVQVLINYDEQCKDYVMEGIQSFILKWIRFMPLYSFSITYIDPNDRGSNLGKLQKLEEITSWDICKKAYASREDIARRLKELEQFVDTTCSRLAGVDSSYEYNKYNESFIVQHLIVINDYPDKFDRTAEEALEVLVNNAEKCGISMIFMKKGNLSELPSLVQKSFHRINVSRNGATVQIDSKSYDFQFDTICSNCEQFIEDIKSNYNDGFKVDNLFSNYFSLENISIYRDSTKSIQIPFAVDSRRKIVELELGKGINAHALLSGSTGSGKTQTLYMLISSIMIHYHPDDVEMWLVDYNKVSFAEYKKQLPPHVKLLGLETGAEFTFSLLDKINSECQRRMDLFKNSGVNDITEYKERYGARSLPRILLIIDEFHQMTQTIQSEQEYILILENMLSEYRKFGLTCIFSDQAVSVGLRGLTDKGKMQIRTRIAMANVDSEIRETLSIDNSFYDDALKNKMTRMSEGDVIFRRTIKDSLDQVQIVVDRYRTVYIKREEREKCFEATNKLLGSSYIKKDVVIADGQGRKFFDERSVEQYEKIYGGPTGRDIPIYIGSPASLELTFRFMFQEKLDSNAMIIGSDTEMRASIILYTISCFSRISDTQIYVFSDERDELFYKYQSELKSFNSDRIVIVSNLSKICRIIDGMLDNARDGKKPRTLLVWLGIESIGSDMSLYSEKLDEKKEVKDNSINTLMSELDDLLAGIEASEKKNPISISECEKINESDIYDARDDISKLISIGPRFGIHNLITYSSVKTLRQSKFVKPENFEHKIAFKMSRDDWSNYLERLHYNSELDDISAIYYDGGSSSHLFRPYLF